MHSDSSYLRRMIQLVIKREIRYTLANIVILKIRIVPIKVNYNYNIIKLILNFVFLCQYRYLSY